MKKLKVFQMNDCDWWADFSIEEARVNYLKFVGLPEEDAYFKDDPPFELSRESMERLKFQPDPYGEPNAPSRTFQEELEKNIKENSNQPFFFASTEY